MLYSDYCCCINVVLFEIVGNISDAVVFCIIRLNYGDRVLLSLRDLHKSSTFIIDYSLTRRTQDQNSQCDHTHKKSKIDRRITLLFTLQSHK